MFKFVVESKLDFCLCKNKGAESNFLGLLGEAVLTSAHNLCFGAEIRKIGIPLHTPVLLYKTRAQGGIHYTDMFS